MNTLLFKLLTIFGITLFILLTGFIILIFFTGPKLPDNTDIIIKNVINAKLPELIKGKSGYVVSDNYKIWYESISPRD